MKKIPQKTLKTTRENMSLPVKFSENLPVKNSSHPWKNPEKGQKRAFTGYFDFTGEKKHWQTPFKKSEKKSVGKTK